MKILVFRGLYLGDLVAATGALRALRKGFPRAEISLATLPWAAVLAPHLSPYVDRLLPYPGAPGLDGEGDEEELKRFLARVRAEQFDLAINMHGKGPTSTRLVARFGARRTAGFASEDAAPLDVTVPWDAEEHESRKLLLLAEKTGGIPAGASGSATPELRIRAEDDRRARALLPAGLRHGPLALVHPGASVPEKRWPEESFAMVAEGLLRRGYAVAATGGPGEKELTRRVSRAVPGVRDLGGRTDLSTLVALVSRADVLVANDTGPAHLAYASKTPSVTLFGPSTDVARWGPLDRGRHAVLCGDPISEVSASAVLENVEGLIPGRERSA